MNHSEDPTIKLSKNELPDVSGEAVAGPDALQAGETIDDFEILEKVGEGGMGAVYRAHEKSLRRVVAIKMLHPAIAGNPSAAKRFRREAVLAANLSHPNIVPVFHIDRNEIPRYFTMEFVQGRSVKDKVQQEGYLAPGEVIRMAGQACDALEYAHMNNIIHRDIKPGNILLQNHIERVRITDFGIAHDTTGQLAEVTMTEGISLGTPAFMSPEQNLGEVLDARTDIFSLGMTLYYMLTGEMAYTAKNRQELALAFEKQTPQPPSRINPDIDAGLDAIIMKMIRPDRGSRYRHCGQIINDLRSLGGERSVTPTVVTAHEGEAGEKVKDIIAHAVSVRATDIHIDSVEDGTRVVYRIDGQLHADGPSVSGEIREAVIRRIKEIAHMDMEEKAFPQDARATFSGGETVRDARVSVVPGFYGPNAVIRLLPEAEEVVFSMEKLGMDPIIIEQYRRWLTRDHGIILSTGPTGSGKSTVLYALLRELDPSKKIIVSVENPVFVAFPGINQMQIDPEKGLTYPMGIKAQMQQDPDAIMIDEIRDGETLNLMLSAALTGHQVFSVMHCGDAVAAIQRLIHLGVDIPFLRDALIGISAQRLVRKLCVNCKKEYAVDHDRWKDLGIKKGEALFAAAGCDECRGTGFRGRTALIEMLEMNEILKKALKPDIDEEQLRAKAVESGMIPFMDAGVAMARKGITTMDEVLKVVG